MATNEESSPLAKSKGIGCWKSDTDADDDDAEAEKAAMISYQLRDETAEDDSRSRRHDEEFLSRSDTFVNVAASDSVETESCEEEEDLSISLAELLYSASSFHAIAKPVSVTMMCAALAAVYINNEQVLEQQAQQFAKLYTVWKIDTSGDSHQNTGQQLVMSIANTLVMVTVICGMTFGIVLLYKYRCMKCLIGYMVFSSGTLLGILGGTVLGLAIEIYRLPVDVFTYYFSCYNFAVVGVIAIFYQLGVPSYITQNYLVATSVILAWHLSHFDDWTAWSLLVMLALYDLCAVLTPCGPLKALVNLMQEEDSPDMPGLLYEAQLPSNVRRHTNTSRGEQNRNNISDQTRSKTGTTTNATESLPIRTEGSATPDPVVKSGGLVELPVHRIPSETPDTPLTAGTTVRLPLAIARLYKLPIVSMYGSVSRKQSASSKRLRKSSSGSSVSDSPLLGDNVDPMPPPAAFYQQSFTQEMLIADVEAELPQHGGKIVKNRDRDGKVRFVVTNREGEVKRVLMVTLQGKVLEIVENHDGDDESSSDGKFASSIRLGLGDFIFYSVLVAKAALYSFTTFAACMLVILAGLGGTLVLLSVYHHALPALPISIFLGVTFYLLTRLAIEPWIEDVLRTPFYA